MKWSRFFISILMTGIATATTAGERADSLPLPEATAPALLADEPQQTASAYEQRARRYHERWDKLIPTQFVLQNAGNMGIASVGLGWNYGHRQQWETHLLWGYIPKHQSPRGKLTMTVKENFLPWSLELGRGLSVEPLSASIYLNTVYGHEFWKTQPKRYPDKYYEFMSTKFRLNVALGQRISWVIPHDRRRRMKSISLFYEVSSCDLYIRCKFMDKGVPLKDILGLSIGMKLQML